MPVFTCALICVSLLLINWWKLKNFNSFAVFFTATVQSVKRMYLIEVKNITLPCIEVLGVFSWRILLCLALKYWECSAEEYYFALHWSIGSVQLKNVNFLCLEVLEVFNYSVMSNFRARNKCRVYSAKARNWNDLPVLCKFLAIFCMALGIVVAHYMQL